MKRFLLIAVPVLVPLAATASDFITTDKTIVFTMEPPHLVYTGEGGKLIFDIAPDGTVKLGDGVSSDQASRAFWKSVQHMGVELACGEPRSRR